eukprot:TRINITY_DN20270_c0_g1_i1.p1 TRINITY_DN20270_c0_g1~~TRINITY_DN20270_c0_g1_i1.p1  ORF type:complete len:349 (+),score=47.43 TRINITY_DN20270_c0_g1_i1:34-1047(+)
MFKLLFIAAAVSAVTECDVFNALRADSLRIQMKQHSEAAAFTPTEKNVKHTPVVTVDGGDGVVVVPHPTTTRAVPGLVHFIERIWVENQDGTILAMWVSLGKGEPQLSFKIPEGTTLLKPYSLCNKHGLFAGADVNVESGSGEGVVCSLTTNVVEPDDACTGFGILDADTIRKQLAEHNQKVAFQPNDKNTKHTPVITLDGATANVTVGYGTVTGKKWDIHPMVATADREKVHFIERIFVRNQRGEIIAASVFLPTDTTPFLTFEVPKGTTSMVAFSYCNKHGLFLSTPTQIPEDLSLTEPHSCNITATYHLPVEPEPSCSTSTATDGGKSCSNPDA